MDKKILDLTRRAVAKLDQASPMIVEGAVLHFPINHRVAPVGAVHKWGDGKHYRKTATGWEVVPAPAPVTGWDGSTPEGNTHKVVSGDAGAEVISYHPNLTAAQAVSAAMRKRYLRHYPVLPIDHPEPKPEVTGGAPAKSDTPAVASPNGDKTAHAYDRDRTLAQAAVAATDYDTFGKNPVKLMAAPVPRPAGTSLLHTHGVFDSKTGAKIATLTSGSVPAITAASGIARQYMRANPGAVAHVAPLTEPTDADREAHRAEAEAAVKKRDAEAAAAYGAVVARGEGPGYLKRAEQIPIHSEAAPESVPAPLASAIAQFAAMVRDRQFHNMVTRGYTHKFMADREGVSVKYKRGYAYVDVGTSGRYMVALQQPGGKLAHLKPGDVVGIKAYGVPHAGHRYGNVLDGTMKLRSW